LPSGLRGSSPRRDGDPRTWGIAHRQLVWDWNHVAPAAEHWMQGLLAADLSVLRLSAKFPADPVYAVGAAGWPP
jgi:hypothetical protein